MHTDGRNKNISVLGEEPTQGLDNATITAEAKYPINFTESGKRFVLSLYYNGRNSSLFVYAVEMYEFHAKVSKIKPYLLCLGNISIGFTIDNMKKYRIKMKCKSFFC